MDQGITRAGARLVVCAMERPNSVSRTQWKGVRAFLLMIADHYPNAYPSQERLAGKLGKDVRSIQRYQKLAVGFGMLQVTPDAGVRRTLRGRVKTNRYHIVLDDKCRAVLADKCRTKAPQEPHCVSLSAPPASLLLSEEAGLVPPSSARMVRWKEAEKQVDHSKPPRQVPRKAAAQPNPKPTDVLPEVHYQDQPSPAQSKRPPWKTPPWKRLADYFVVEWQGMIDNTKRNDHLRDVRILDSFNHCKQYFGAHFIGPNAATPVDEAAVRAYIGRFVEDVYSGRVRVKTGQSAWMCFTGAWGHDNKPRGYSETKRAQESYVVPVLPENQ